MKGVSQDATFSKLIVIFVLILGVVSMSVNIYAQNEDETLAVVNGRNIKQSDINSLIPAQYIIVNQQQSYALRKVALENFIIRILLEEEAERKKIPVELLRKQMTLGMIEVPYNKVEQEYLKNALYFASMSPDEAKERIRLDLESEAKMQLYLNALSKLKARANIKIVLKEPRISLNNISEIDYPSKGPKDAKITIIEFSDFRCPYCRNSQEIIKKVLTVYKENVRLIYKNLPLQTDLQGLSPAIAAHCANSQDRFWEFHDSLFNSTDLSPASIKHIAKETGLDLTKFDKCFVSETSRFAVLNDLKEAMQLGITGTPTFIINGIIYSGKLDFDEFKNIIERELSPTERSTKQQ